MWFGWAKRERENKTEEEVPKERKKINKVLCRIIFQTLLVGLVLA